jgi:SanA protein
MFRAFSGLSAIVLLFVIACNLWIIFSTRNRIFSSAAEIPQNDVGVVLGTSKYVKTGVLNLHFQNRMAAAAELFRLGRVKHLIVSGDNAERWHDEPTDMKKALQEHGVPDSAITRDYAGFRTLDSVVRAKKIFGIPKFTIISDKFHTYRAVFLCDHFDIEAIAFSSRDVPFNVSYKVKSREIIARVKAILDIYVLGTEPKVLDSEVALPVH